MDVAQELSIQLYSLREYGNLDRQLTAMADLGFRRVELVGSHLEDAEATRSSLDAHGISAPTGHVSMDDLRNRPDWVVERAKMLGIVELYMPALPENERDAPAEQWEAAGAELGEISERFGKDGLALGYHNHHWELKPYADGTTPLQHFFAGAEGSPLTFEADLAWLVRGGANPLDWMQKFSDRLTAIHVKDLAEAGSNLDEDGWSNVGAGTLDWPVLWRKALDLGAKWMVLEHDKPKDPVGFAAASRAYLLEQFA